MMPCPFCGVKAYFIDQGVRQLVECGGCGVEMEGLDREDAIAHWNTRAALSSLPQSDDRELTLGVGDGSGKLFVHGSYDAIKRTQQIIFEYERLSRDVDLLREALTKILEDQGCLDGDKCPHWVEWHNVARAALSSGISEQGEM
jgi:hypothetical protein